MTLMGAGFVTKQSLASDSSGFQYWSNADFSVDLRKDWQAAFSEQFRLGDEGVNLYYHCADLGFVYISRRRLDRFRIHLQKGL